MSEPVLEEYQPPTPEEETAVWRDWWDARRAAKKESRGKRDAEWAPVLARMAARLTRQREEAPPRPRSAWREARSMCESKAEAKRIMLGARHRRRKHGRQT